MKNEIVFLSAFYISKLLILEKHLRPLSSAIIIKIENRKRNNKSSPCPLLTAVLFIMEISEHRLLMRFFLEVRLNKISRN